jgi:hypothetical protein
MASSNVSNLYGSSLLDPLVFGFPKKTPALTTAQARQLVAPTLTQETQPLEDALASINYHQRRNYAAYCSHRKHTQKKLYQRSKKVPHRKTS